MIAAVIFDMDGVLIDSTATAYKVRSALLARHGIDMSTVPDPQNEDHRGASMQTLLQAVHQHHGVALDKTQFAQEMIAFVRQDLHAQGIVVDPTLVRFLQDLQDHGIPCAITSSGLAANVATKLDILGIQDFFRVIVTANDVQKHKPSPESYLLTMQKLGVQPQHCVIFEDSITGVQAGLAAGGTVVGFVKYNPGADSLAGTAATIHDWADVSYDALADLVAQ